MAFNGQLNVVQAVKQLASKDASIFASGVMTYPYRLLIMDRNYFQAELSSYFLKIITDFLNHEVSGICAWLVLGRF